ncbi:hypothetical protein D3C80_1646870 [compost metagenome]
MMIHVMYDFYRLGAQHTRLKLSVLLAAEIVCGPLFIMDMAIKGRGILCQRIQMGTQHLDLLDQGMLFRHRTGGA